MLPKYGKMQSFLDLCLFKGLSCSWWEDKSAHITTLNNTPSELSIIDDALQSSVFALHVKDKDKDTVSVNWDLHNTHGLLTYFIHLHSCTPKT